MEFHCEILLEILLLLFFAKRKFYRDTNVIFFSGYVTQEDKAKFGLLVQHQEGRDWFAKFVDSQVMPVSFFS